MSMSLVSSLYGSSSSDEDDGGSTSFLTQCSGRSKACGSDTSAPARSDTAVQRDPVTIRQAVANQFALRASYASHRELKQSRCYAYTPYQPKRVSHHTTNATKSKMHDNEAALAQPLFSTLHQAASAPIPPSPPPQQQPSTSVVVPVLPSRQNSANFIGHSAAINTVHWNPRYPPLFLSASMDRTVRIWSMPRAYYDSMSTASQPPPTNSLIRRILSHHSKGVKTAKWSADGRSVWSGGYDGKVAYVDAETSSIVLQYNHTENEYASAISTHPTDPHLALCGANKGRILLRDTREKATNPGVAFPCTSSGEIHDLLFLPSTTDDWSVVSASALTTLDAAHKTLLVWDFRSRAVVADRVHHELSAFHRFCLHPSGTRFAAISSENEAILFQATAPFKPVKPRRSFRPNRNGNGDRIHGSFNADGSLFATGSGDGRLVLYSYTSQQPLTQLNMFGPNTPCTVATFHPRWRSTLLCGGSNGRLVLYDTHSRDD